MNADHSGSDHKMSSEMVSRLPVIVGVGLVSAAQTLSDAEHMQSDPIDLMTQAARQAVEDCGVAEVLNAVDLAAVVGGLWSYRNPAALVAQRLGVHPGRTLLTDFGGQVPVQLCADVAARIQRGELDIAIVLGGEANATRRSQTRRGLRPAKPDDTSDPPDEFWGSPLVMGDESAVSRGADHPRNAYAVLESALRARRGETHQQSRKRAAAICAGYSRVAATNPHAASGAMSIDEIQEPSTTNRMVSWPYTKAMCANNTVDHAGAIIMCSNETADRLGVASDRRIYPHAYCEGSDTDTLAERDDVAEAPGLRATARALADAIGGIERVTHLDLYCCYPSMVTLTAEALGIDLDQTMTVTGGLGFAGAPINFAAGEGLIGMVETLRSDPGTLGVVQANGGFASKHAFAVLSSTPPPGPCIFAKTAPTRESRPMADAEARGSAVIDGITVEFDRHGPTRAIALVRFEDGSRGWANADDAELMRSITETEWVGRTVAIANGHFADR